MASPSATFLLLLSFLLIATTISARPGRPFHPCNTLVISTYSFSVLPQNPNSLHPLHRPHFLLVSSDLHPYHHHFRHRRFLPLTDTDTDTSQSFESPKTRPEFLPSSFRDRTKDILSVVASLLFGAACGALTAGTMYLIWSLFNHRNGSYRSFDAFASDSDNDNDNDDDDLYNPKKTGYVAIPAAPANTVDSIPSPAVPVSKDSA